MLSQIDLNKLKVFYLIYLKKSVNSAAEELCVTPSAVSQHLKKLEVEIGVRLFTRMHKRLAPTSEAERLYTILKPFFLELSAGIAELKTSRDAVSGMLRVGAPVEFGKEHFPRIIAEFRRFYPNVVFSLTLGNSEKLLTMIKEGGLDFAAVDLFVQQKQYVGELGVYSIESLIDEEILLACSRTYYDQHLNGDTSPGNLLSQEFISYDHNILAISGWFRHHFNKQGVKVNTVLTVDSVQAVVSAIENDIGLGVVTDNAIRQQVKAGTIRVVKSNRKDIVNKISLVQLQDKIPTFSEKKFQAHLKSLIDSL